MLLHPQSLLEPLAFELQLMHLLLEMTTLTLDVEYSIVDLHVLPVHSLILPQTVLNIDSLGGIQGVDEVVQLRFDVPGYSDLRGVTGRSSEGLLDFPELIFEGCAYFSPERLKHMPIVGVVLVYLTEGVLHPFVLLPEDLVALDQFPDLRLCAAHDPALVVLLTVMGILGMSSSGEFEFSVDIFLILAFESMSAVMVDVDYLVLAVFPGFLLGTDFYEAFLQGDYLAVHLPDLQVQAVCLSDLGVEDRVDVVLTAF